MYKHRPTAISHLRQTDLHFQVALTVIIFKYLTWIRMMKGPLWTEPQSNWLGLDLLNNLAYCPTEETHVLFIWPQKTQSTEGETCHKMNLTEKHPCPLSETRCSNVLILTHHAVFLSCWRQGPWYIHRVMSTHISTPISWSKAGSQSELERVSAATVPLSCHWCLPFPVLSTQSCWLWCGLCSLPAQLSSAQASALRTITSVWLNPLLESGGREKVKRE